MEVDRPLHIQIAGRTAVYSEEKCNKHLPNSVYSYLTLESDLDFLLKLQSLGL